VGLISLRLYKENNKLRDWKTVFTPHIPPWAPHTYGFIVLTSLSHPRKSLFVVLKIGSRKIRRLISTPTHVMYGLCFVSVYVHWNKHVFSFRKTNMMTLENSFQHGPHRKQTFLGNWWSPRPVCIYEQWYCGDYKSTLWYGLWFSPSSLI
jgi:hypothetical protein